MDPYAALAQMPLFAELQRDDLARLGAGLRRRRYAKGAAICWQGDPGTTLFLIESGWVKIVATSPDGQEAVLNLLGPGDFFGDLALLDGKPRSAGAVAAEESHLLLLERDAFVGAIEESPRLALGLLAALAGRLRYDVEMLADTSFLDVSGRLARVLLRLATAPDRPAGPAMTIPIRLTQAELAALIGATRESVNKWLKAYEAQGIIRRRGARLTILRPEELRKRIG
jgi:CRP/FNR family cyclic AMP-dependent transcriptional regulator